MTISSKIELKITFKGLDSSDAVKAYAEKRISKLSKHLHKLITCEFVFMVNKTKQIAQLQVASDDFEARAESQEESLYAAIDDVVDKMVQQTRKYKEKNTSHAGLAHHNHTNDVVEAEVETEDEQ
jgi:putative sigma-54 modulation protein